MNFSHMLILLTCYVHHLYARQLCVNGESSKCKHSAFCPRVIKGKPKEATYPFLLLRLYFFPDPSQQDIVFHLFTCPTKMSFWKVLYVNESETFLKESRMSSLKKAAHLSSLLSCSCLSGLQRKCWTVLMSFQAKTNLVCSIIWVSKENIPLGSRLGWVVDKSPITE